MLRFRLANVCLALAAVAATLVPATASAAVDRAHGNTLRIIRYDGLHQTQRLQTLKMEFTKLKQRSTAMSACNDVILSTRGIDGQFT